MPTRMSGARSPIVAGMFYEADPDALRRQIQACFLQAPGPGQPPALDPGGPRSILGLVAPHAGLMYSGYAAAHAYLRLGQDGPVEVAVIFAPNHHGMGADNAVWADGIWEMPLGSVPVAADVADAILQAAPFASSDPLAHLHDHAVEVHLPFLQVLYGTAFAIVPIAMKHYQLRTCLALGEAIAQAVAGRNAVVIASSDFSHYEPAGRARKQDESALEAIENLDPVELFRRVREQGITTCGYGPVAAMLAAAGRMGAAAAHTLAYTTSGDITGDLSRVVGYAAVEVTR